MIPGEGSFQYSYVILNPYEMRDNMAGALEEVAGA